MGGEREDLCLYPAMNYCINSQNFLVRGRYLPLAPSEGFSVTWEASPLHSLKNDSAPVQNRTVHALLISMGAGQCIPSSAENSLKKDWRYQASSASFPIKTQSRLQNKFKWWDGEFLTRVPGYLASSPHTWYPLSKRYHVTNFLLYLCLFPPSYPFITNNRAKVLPVVWFLWFCFCQQFGSESLACTCLHSKTVSHPSTSHSETYLALKIRCMRHSMDAVHSWSWNNFGFYIHTPGSEFYCTFF